MSSDSRARGADPLTRPAGHLPIDGAAGLARRVLGAITAVRRVPATADLADGYLHALSLLPRVEAEAASG